MLRESRTPKGSQDDYTPNMGVRAIRARIQCDPETLQHLWRTHCVFNQRLPVAIGWLFRMRRGECGADDAQRALYKEIADFVIGAPAKSNFDYLMNSVSKPSLDWMPGTAKKIKVKVQRDGRTEEITGETWADRAVDLLSRRVLLYDKRAVYGDLPQSMTAVVIRDAAAAIASHDALTKIWQAESKEWTERKEKWEREHPEYMRLRDRFAEGECDRRGRFGKRSERDHAYLDWLEKNPTLAAWRGGEARVVPLDDHAKDRVAKAKRWKQASKRAEEFWKVNPELHALHRLHIEYEREFARRRRTSTNKWREGFKRRPTFTTPDPLRHPRWCQFNAPQTSPPGYKDLTLPAHRRSPGSLRMRLLTGPRADGKHPDEWIDIQFRADPRMAALRRVSRRRTITRGARAGQEVEAAHAYCFRDDQLGVERDARISGVRLIFRGLPPRNGYTLSPERPPPGLTPYLVFTVEVKDQPRTERAKKITFHETGEQTKSGKRRKRKALPEGLVSVAVDLDARGVGFLTRAVSGLPESAWTHDGVQVVQSRYLDIRERIANGDGAADWLEGPTLEHIRDHKRQIGRARRQRGKPVKGERSHIRLQSHITNMGEDRFKKAARKIVNEAFRGCNTRTGEAHPRADVLLMEDLKWFNPDAIRERGINRMLANWNRAHLMQFIEQFAADAGLRHGKAERVSAWGTSQVCSKCGALGKRYRIERDAVSRRPVLRFAGVNEPLPLFACPNPKCRGRRPERPGRPFTCNADHNASINLHRRYVLGDAATAAFSALPKDASEKRDALGRIEQILRPALERLHKLSANDLETPF